MVSLNEDSLKQWQTENLEGKRYEYDLNHSDLCLDIGSYRREWAEGMILRYGCQVECFDALDNKAAWIYNGKIHVGGAYYYTSMFDDNITHEYWCVDIAPYLQQEIAVLKMNIEGGEYQLLEYIISKGLMKNIRNLQVQFHLISGRDCLQMYGVLARLLRTTHEITWRYPFCWENWRRKTITDTTFKTDDPITC